jgi:hypothetical protein
VGKPKGNAGFTRTRNAGVDFDPSTSHEREEERSADRGMMMKVPVSDVARLSFT